MNQTKQRKHTGKKFLVTVIALLTLLVGCVGCKKANPEDALDKAIEKTFTNANPEEKLLGLEALNKAIEDKAAYSSGVSVTLEALSGAAVDDYADMLAGLGFSVDSATDTKNKKSEANLGVSYGGTTALNFVAQFDASKFYMMLPQLLSGSISINFDTVANDIASNDLFASALAFDPTLLESLDFDYWEILEDAEALDIALPSNITKAYEKLNDAIVVKEIKVKEADLPSSVSAKTAYTMTISKKAYSSFITEVAKTMMDMVAESLSAASLPTDTPIPDDEAIADVISDMADDLGDIVITFAVNKAGYITYIASEINVNDIPVTFNAAFTGKDSPLEDMKFELSATDENNDTIAVEFSQKFDSKEKTVTYNGELTFVDFTATVKAEGEYSDIEKGKKYTFDLNYLEFDCSEDISFTLSGSSYVDTTTCDIATPEGTERELFKMTVEDFQALVVEVMTNVQNNPLFSEILESFGM